MTYILEEHKAKERLEGNMRRSTCKVRGKYGRYLGVKAQGPEAWEIIRSSGALAGGVGVEET